MRKYLLATTIGLALAPTLALAEPTADEEDEQVACLVGRAANFLRTRESDNLDVRTATDYALEHAHSVCGSGTVSQRSHTYTLGAIETLAQSWFEKGDDTGKEDWLPVFFHGSGCGIADEPQVFERRQRGQQCPPDHHARPCRWGAGGPGRKLHGGALHPEQERKLVVVVHVRRPAKATLGAHERRQAPHVRNAGRSARCRPSLLAGSRAGADPAARQARTAFSRPGEPARAAHESCAADGFAFVPSAASGISICDKSKCRKFRNSDFAHFAHFPFRPFIDSMKLHRR